MKKILITGGAGFIGSYLANSLFKQGNRVDIARIYTCIRTIRQTSRKLN